MSYARLLCSAWVVAVLCLLVIIPAFSQTFLTHARAFRPDGASVKSLEMSDRHPVWSDSMEFEIDFNLVGMVHGCSVTPDFYFDFNRSLEVREATVEYAIICNGQVARQTEHSSDPGTSRTYGRYDKNPIDLDLLRSGENRIVLRVSVFSESSSEQPRDSFLKIQVGDVLVDVEFADGDMDGLLDLTDPMVGENNLIDPAAIIMFGMPIVGYAGVFIDKRRE